MPAFAHLLSQPKSRRAAVIMALLGTVTPIVGLHKFYLGQTLWGVIYILLWSTPIPRIACAIDAVWYLLQEQQFNQKFNRGWAEPVLTTDSLQTSSSTLINETNPSRVGAIAEALRQLDQLRIEGLLSEYEFEQKRRQLLDRVV